MHPFQYDPFQTEAIAAIRQGLSVFVCAPTGAGKTLLAEVAVEEALRTSGGVAIYTAPIKALSNQKFRDFYSRYGEKVGILTGDVTLNADAPFLIMTTEIYRNSLFSATRHESWRGGSAKQFGGQEKARFARCRWVIFDEVHYIDDPERGTVWEEALLLTPRETEILALSATIPNAQQLAAWIERTHGRPVQVVQETHRPVPLRFLFQAQDNLYTDVEPLKTEAYHNQPHWGGTRRRPFRMRRMRSGRRYFKTSGLGVHREFDHRGRPNRADHLLRTIQEAGRLPCLYFAFSRRRVEDLAWEFAALALAPPKLKSQLLDRFDALTEKYQIRHEPSASAMRELVAQGVAFHHAGLLPTLKEVVEILFTSRLIQVIVTTETFALGVNMPARSVVLDTLTRRSIGLRSGRLGPHLLTVREVAQMAGRAGRRGMDEAGFVYLRVNPWEVPFPELTNLIHGKPEQISSRFSLTYATVLNLYRSHEMELLSFYQKTLHAFQSSPSNQREAFDLIKRKLTLLQRLGYLSSASSQGSPEQKRSRLTPKGEFAADIYGYELLLSELFEKGFLDRLPWIDLGILLLACTYEARRGGPPVKLSHRLRTLEAQTDEVLQRIHQEERTLRVSPLTKKPEFQLSGAMELWLSGARFDRIVQAGHAAEGELIRYFRMTVQLCRALALSPAAKPSLKEKAHRLLQQINRDQVDAEAELRRSL